MSNQVSKKHKTSVGGQALIEGIMMRGPKGAAMSVRLPNGTIETEYKDVKPWREKNKFFSLPLVRGIVGFVESLVTGYGYLMESAEKSTQGLENPPEEELSKFDKWIEKHFGEKMMNIVGVISAVLGFGIAFFLFMWLPSFVVDKVTFGKLLEFHPLFEGIIRIIIFVLYMLAVSYMKDIHRVFMYHGAEHKCINCIEHGLELNVENVRKSSKQHKRCGTSFLLIVMLVSILCFMFIDVDSKILRLAIRFILIPFIAGVSFEFIRLAGKYDNWFVNMISKPGLWMQKLTTKEPDDTMIEVGIASVEAVFDWRAWQKEAK